MRTETVEVKVPQYVGLDPKLVASPPEPDAPPARCRDVRGKKTVCNEDVLSYLDGLRAWGRGLSKQIKEIAGLQPKQGEEK